MFNFFVSITNSGINVGLDKYRTGEDEHTSF